MLLPHQGRSLPFGAFEVLKQDNWLKPVLRSCYELRMPILRHWPTVGSDVFP